MDITRRQMILGFTTMLLAPALATGAWGQTPKSDAATDGVGRHGKFRMGARTATTRDFNRRPIFRVARGERPSKLSLTEYLPPVSTQGEQGSCAAWAVGYYVYSYSAFSQRKLPADKRSSPDFIFSPAFIYNQLNGGKDKGLLIHDVFELLRDKGCATLSLAPYNDKDYTSPPTPQAIEEAQRFKARGIACLYKGAEEGEPADIETLKMYLSEAGRPFVISIPVFSDFPSGPVAEDYVYNTDLPFDLMEGRHAVAIVGYDDEKKAFLMVNSWGPEWGNKGFLWLSQDFVRDKSREGWAQIPGGPIARPIFRGPMKISPHVTILPPKEAAPVR
jgi:hypothetical protein